MIKTEEEYLEAKKKLEQEFQDLENHKLKMKKAGVSEDHLRLAIDPLSSFALQLKEEVEEYEKLRRGQFEVIENLNGIGRMLVALRIFKGMKQKDLADKLEVTETQISKDEHNEYHGSSIEKIQKVLNALDVVLRSELETPL
ncbi:MAG: helix-turn-helix transcriptional regulator [Oligoflexia bacterium]|nr:helix-turn-helix transcriptional regulator [Oligoflexia bacterium]